MKFKSFGSLVASAITIGASTIIPQPTQAQTQPQFVCGMSMGKPATLVRTQRGQTVTLIVWTNQDFTASGWTPERRCQAISTRFQRFNSNGQLKQLKTGTVSGQPVICAANNNVCSSSTVLITLPRGTNANATLDRLLNTRVGASLTPIYLSPEDDKAIKLSYDKDGNAFVDVDAVVDQINW
jgi:hypothetical protein